ncbi:TRAG family protein [Xylanibacillus composti]|uniref:hypothetical protein n=1 Tax=Xylanibacillus composti TaxID=1572762 RepID=UPI001BCE8A62|nr:hypothetical protein [Xylanibacillus composti]MDT9723609.1 TRAG family protein [Xylanibacillus composti]
MKTKQKSWLACLIIVLGGVGNLFISTAHHFLLSGETSRLALPSLAACLDSLLTHRAHLLLFVCLQSIVLVLAVLFFVMNSQPYQSKLRQVAPGIETPVPTGQHQHGSARWLREDEWPRTFDHYSLDLRHPFIRHLIHTGYDDLQFLKSSEQEVVEDETVSSEDNSKA